MKKLNLNEFKEFKIDSIHAIKGGASTTLNGVQNGDTVYEEDGTFVDNTTGEVYCGGNGRYGACN